MDEDIRKAMQGGEGPAPVPVNREASVEFGPRYPVKQENPRGGKGKKFLTGLLILCLGFGSGVAGAVVAEKSGLTASSVPGPTLVVSEQGDEGKTVIKTDSNLNTAEVIAAATIPSVVGITTETEVSYFSIFGPSTSVLEGVGTGFIISEDGYIVTNSHVVDDGAANHITVQLTDGSEYAGKVVWQDTAVDLAVVKVDAKGLVPLEMGDSDAVNIGAYVVAIGNPLGMEYDRSVTQGIISGLNRTIQVSADGYGSQTQTMTEMMQTDAAINSGNSGGPLFNSKGQVIGINTAVNGQAENMGFAIPINQVKGAVSQILEEGTFSKPYIGVSYLSIDEYRSYFPQYAGSVEEGLYVLEVKGDSPAAKADIRVGDVLTKIDSTKLTETDDLQKALYNYKAGDTVTVTLVRNEKELTIDVALEEQPSK